MSMNLVANFFMRNEANPDVEDMKDQLFASIEVNGEAPMQHPICTG